MADSKLSNLPTGSAVADSDLFYSAKSSNSVKQPASALKTYASASPVLTGTPTAPTASVGTNTTQIATTAFVQQNLPLTKLAADVNYFVSPTGDDSNSGLSGSPWLTLQHAADVMSTLDLNGFRAFINLQTGTYAGAQFGNLYSSVRRTGNNATKSGSYVQIVGDNTTPSNVVITNNPFNSGCFYGVGQVSGYVQGVFITGVRLNPTSGPTISADPSIWVNGSFGASSYGARFVLGTNDALFNGLIEVANVGAGQSIFSGAVTDTSSNGGIFTVNILANLFTNNPNAVFSGLSGAYVTLTNSDYFIVGGTLTCTKGIYYLREPESYLALFPGAVKIGVGGGYSGAQYYIDGGANVLMKCNSPLSDINRRIPSATAGILKQGRIIDNDGTVLTGNPGSTTFGGETVGNASNPVLGVTQTWNNAAITTTGASGTGVTATITFAQQNHLFEVGASVTVAGVTPVGYNGTYVITASTYNSVSYANVTTGAQTVAGTVQNISPFTAVKANVTDTSSPSNSLLVDLQVGGTSKFKVDKAGNVTATSFSSSGSQARTTSDINITSNTSLADLTGLSVNIQAGRTYYFKAFIPVSAGGNAGGAKFAIGGTATATDIIYHGWGISNNAVAGQGTSTALAGVVASATFGAPGVYVTIEGTITVNTNGTLTVQGAQSTSNASATTIRRGATFYVYDMT